jgi:hypothetical protein
MYTTTFIFTIGILSPNDSSPPNLTHLPPTSHSGWGDDVFSYGSMAVSGVFQSISLLEVALFLSER